MKRLVAILTLVSITGCGVSADYVSADEKTYGVIAPAHKAYVEADTTLSQEQKQRRLDLLASWKLRIDKNK